MYDSKTDCKFFKRIDIGYSIEIDVQIVKLHLGHALIISGNNANNSDIKVTIDGESESYYFHHNTTDQTMVRGFILHGSEYDKPIKVQITVGYEVKMDETICL
jgi:hypothetical protein